MNRRRKRILAEFLVLTLLINMFFTGVTQEIAYAASGTITFNTADGTSMGSLLEDGQWNSTDISGIQLKFFNANSASDATNEVLAGGFTYSTTYGGITAIDTSIGITYQYTVIKAQGGSKFSLNSIYLNDWNGGMGATIECYDGTTFLGSDSVNADSGVYFNTSSVPNPSKYQAITEIRIRNSTDITYGNTIAINKISIGDPILPNTAPILNPINPILPSITEDATISGGQVINSFIGTSITDSDTGAKKGIAIISTDNQNGAWQYSVDGIFWNAIGSVSTTSALLLRVEDKVRFVPNGKNGSASPAKITYKAWDQTHGAYGSRVDCSLSGGSSAFSINSDTVSLTIADVNDAPVLTTGHSFTSISEGDINNPGNSVADIAGTSITDVDTNSAKGIAIISSNNGNGTWQYSIDSGTTWTNIDVVTSASSLLLRAIDRVRFVPNGMKGTTASITYRAWDTTTGTYGSKQSSAAYGGTTAFSSASNPAGINVSNVNYPPTLTSVTNLNGVDKTNTITYADLAAAADESDPDGDTISFRIEAINTGTLRKNSTLAVTAGVTTIGPGESLSWTVPSNTNALLNAFTIKAFDGTVASSTAVQVKVNVQDTTKPVITSVDRPSDGAYIAGNSLGFSIHSSENLYVTQGGPEWLYLDLKLGVKTVRAYYASGSGSNILNFFYPVAFGDYSDLNETTLIPKLQVGGNFIRDIAGNDLVVDFTAPDLSKVKVDTLPPTWEVGYPRVSAITSNSIEIAMRTSDEDATAYYVCLPKGSVEPTYYQVACLQDAMGNHLPSNLSGIIDINKLSDTFVNISSLAPITDYDIYVAIVDRLGNASGTDTKIEAKTKSIPITDLSPSSKTANTATLTWTSTIGASGIVIEQSLASFEDWSPAVTGPLALNANTVKITGLAANTAYKFRLVVAGGVNEGISNVVTMSTDELPSIMSVTGPSNGTYKLGDTLNFNVIYDKNIEVAGGTPSLKLAIGSNIREATYNSGSGSSVLSFRYTIQAGDLDTDGISLASSNISLNNASIINDYYEDASLTLNSIANLSSVLVDGVAPTVTSLSLPTSTTYKTGDKICVTANFDKSAFILPGPAGVPYIELTVGAKKVKAYYYSGSGSQAIKFVYTVESGDFDNDGIDVGTMIASNTGSVKDYVGNEAGYAYSSVDSSGLLVDAVPPTLTNAVMSLDKKSITLTLSKDIVSNVADFGSVINLSTDGGLTYKPVSSLANMNGLSINGKDIVITFDTPLTGSKNKVAIAANSIKDILGNLQTNVVETGNLGLAKPTAVRVPAIGAYKAGSQLNFTVVFDENVILDTSSGTPKLQIAIGSSLRDAVYFSGNGSNEITFAYTVQVGDNDNDGIQIAGTDIDLNGGIIKNSSNVNAQVTLTNVQDSSVVKVDTKAPTITSLILPPNRTYKAGEVITIIANFDEPIIQMVPTTITIKVGGKSVAVPCIPPPPAPINSMVFLYTVTAGDIDEDGISLGTIVAPIGTTKDMAGNDVILSYSSVDTSGILVDAVAPTFVASEISTDKKTITLSFNENIADATSSLLEDSVYLSTNGGSTYNKFSSLSNKGTISINGKDLIVTFAEPLKGSKNRIKIEGNSIKDSFENLKTDATETSDLGASITIGEKEPLTEENLNGEVLTLNIDGETFKDASLDKANFIINNAPKGVTVKDVTYTDSTHGLITLNYDGSDMDSFISNVSVTVLGSELASGQDITTNSIVIKATDDPESISIKNLSPIKEREEDKQVITVTITGGQFADTLDKNNWTVTNLPTGITVGSVTKVDANTAEVELAGNSTVDYDIDITNITVSCLASEYTDSTGGSLLTANNGVILIAKVPGTVVTNPIVSVGKTTATLSGNVTSSGNAIIKEKGFIYREQQKPAELKKVIVTGDSIGEYTATISKLTPNTVYEARAYVENEEDTSLGDVITFTTVPYSTNAKLKDVEVSSETLSHTFDSATKVYTATVEYDVDNITVIPTVEDTGLATVKVNDSSVDSGKQSQDISLKTGKQSQDISLKTGKNTITILVTAEDGITTDTYTLDVYKKFAPIIVDGKVIDKDGNNVDKTKVTVRPEFDGTYTVRLNSNEALLINTASGTKTTIKDYPKLKFISKSGLEGSISGDGDIKFSSLEKGKTYEYNVVCKVGTSELVIGKIKIQISDSGNVEVTSDLIDPYGTITDATNGKVIDGVSVVLFYADTARNRAAGIEPNTEVSLPIIEGFAPNDNKNPQISDSFGSYAFMVYPNKDYYIVATKDGYEKYISPTISIEKEIRKWDFKMNPIVQSTVVSNDKETVIPATGSPIDTKVLVIIGIVFVATGFTITRKKKSNKK